MVINKVSKYILEFQQLFPISEIEFEQREETLNNIFTISINELSYSEYIGTLEKLTVILIEEVDTELTINQNKGSELIENYSKIVEKLIESFEWVKTTNQEIKWDTILKLELKKFPINEHITILPSQINDFEYSEINAYTRQVVNQIYKILHSLEFELRKLSLKLLKTTSGKKSNKIPEKYFTWIGPNIKLDNLYHNLRDVDIINCNKKMFLKAFSGEEFDSQLNIKWKFEGSKNRNIISYTSIFHLIVLLQKKNYIEHILNTNNNLKSTNTKCYNLIHHIFIRSDGSRINNLRQSWFEYNNNKPKDQFAILDRLVD